MSAVGQPEIHTQRRVIAFFQEALGYAYLGNWRDRPDNRNIQLGNRLPALLATWQHKAGVSVHDMRIKKMKTRWGSCNVTARRIWLNLELAKKPPACLEYILVHELIHLLEPGHTARFHDLMDSLMPHWRSCRDTLNRAPLAHADWPY